METKRVAVAEERRVPTSPSAGGIAAGQPPSVGTLIEQLLGRVHGLEVELGHLSVRVREN